MQKYASRYWTLLFTVFFMNISLNLQAEMKNPPYEKVTPAQAVADKSKFEVVELFWYTCPHCYYFETYLDKWKATKADDVAFVQVPAVFNNGRWANWAQVFYTAEHLGLLEKMHKPIFNAIHKEKRSIRTEEDIAQLFADFGVNEKDFKKAFSSFGVDSKVRNAKRLTAKYGINAVPTIIVNGKYRMTSDMTDGYDNLFSEVDKIIDKARQAKAAKPAADQ